MIITHNIQVFLTKEQERIYYMTNGACRWAYNRFITINQEKYKNGEDYMTAYDFSKDITKMKKTPKYEWLNDVSQKAVKESIINADKAYRKFMKTGKGFPRFKSRKRNMNDGYYLYPVNNKYKHNKMKLPVLGWVRIAENSYIVESHIVHASIQRNSVGKFYVTLSTEVEEHEKEVLSNPIGIDVGIKNYVTIASYNSSFTVPSFLKEKKIKKYYEKIEKLQKIVSKKAEINYFRLIRTWMDKHPKEELNENLKNIMKGESYRSRAISRVQLKINRLYKKIKDYRKNFINKLVWNLVKAKPEYIAIENLSVSEMISKSKPEHKESLSKYIQDSGFYYFKTRLIEKCKMYSVEIHLADKYFASSKICSCCGTKKKNLLLSDRTYVCDSCGVSIDRDLNAAINLLEMKSKKYTII